MPNSLPPSAPDTGDIMIGSSPRPRLTRMDTARTVGAISSCTGAGGAITIATVHGSTLVALTMFGVMQLWGACELLVRWCIKWRYMRLHEDLVRRAADHPDDANLRTLLVDSASTSLDDVGERLPVRAELKRVEHGQR
jgi:hypothetical protein